MFRKRKMFVVRGMDVIYDFAKPTGDKYITLAGDYMDGGKFRVTMELEYAKRIVELMNEVIGVAEEK